MIIHVWYSVYHYTWQWKSHKASHIQEGVTTEFLAFLFEILLSQLTDQQKSCWRKSQKSKLTLKKVTLILKKKFKCLSLVKVLDSRVGKFYKQSYNYRLAFLCYQQYACTVDPTHSKSFGNKSLEIIRD